MQGTMLVCAPLARQKRRVGERPACWRGANPPRNERSDNAADVVQMAVRLV